MENPTLKEQRDSDSAPQASAVERLAQDHS